MRGEILGIAGVMATARMLPVMPQRLSPFERGEDQQPGHQHTDGLRETHPAWAGYVPSDRQRFG